MGLNPKAVKGILWCACGAAVAATTAALWHVSTNGGRGRVTAGRPPVTRHALLIGISRYQMPVDHYMPASAAEAENISALLQKVAGFKPADITVLTDKGSVKPTRQNILEQVSRLTERVQPQDVVVVYLGAHGFSSRGEDYLMPWDTDWRSGSAKAATSLASSLVLSKLTQLPAQQILVLQESCRSNSANVGRSTPLNQSSQEPLQRTPVVQASQPKQVRQARADAGATIYSSRLGENSCGRKDGSRNYFSYYLEKGLQSAAADSAGRVTIQGLASYLEKAVTGAVRSELGLHQTPSLHLWGPNTRRSAQAVLCSGRPPGKGGQTAVPHDSPSSPAQMHDNDMQKGFESLFKRRNDEARRHFTSAFRHDPQSAQAAKEVAEIFYQQRNYAMSTLWLKRVVRLAPRDVTVFNK